MLINDMSRAELYPAKGQPRFSRRLELGADLGPRLRGSPHHKRCKALILDALARQYDVTSSDISGLCKATCTC